MRALIEKLRSRLDSLSIILCNLRIIKRLNEQPIYYVDLRV